MGISNWEILLRLCMAAVLGGSLGLERRWHKKPVGTRTHAIICISGALISMIGAYGFTDLDFVRDPTRLPVGILTGLGFIGAGVIWQSENGVQGLTTAANVFATACLGIAVGFGYYFISVMTTILILIILVSDSLISRFEENKKLKKSILIEPGSEGQTESAQTEKSKES